MIIPETPCRVVDHHKPLFVASLLPPCVLLKNQLFLPLILLKHTFHNLIIIISDVVVMNPILSSTTIIIHFYE